MSGLLFLVVSSTVFLEGLLEGLAQTLPPLGCSSWGPPPNIGPQFRGPLRAGTPAPLARQPVASARNPSSQWKRGTSVVRGRGRLDRLEQQAGIGGEGWAARRWTGQRTRRSLTTRPLAPRRTGLGGQPLTRCSIPPVRHSWKPTFPPPAARTGRRRGPYGPEAGIQDQDQEPVAESELAESAVIDATLVLQKGRVNHGAAC